MAEVAGLVLGVVALAGVCKDCLELFACISAARALGQDYEILETKLDIEKALLLQWAYRVRLLNERPDYRLEDKTLQSTILRILGSIKLLLSEGEKLRTRYGLEQNDNKEGEQHEMVEEGGAIVQTINVRDLRKSDNNEMVHRKAPAIMSGNRMLQFVREFRAMSIRVKDRNAQISTIGKTRWVIRDREKFEKLIQDLSYLIAKLNDFTPATKGDVESLLQDDLAFIRSVDKMHLVLEASRQIEPPVAQQAGLAKQKLVENCRQRILDCLWHRRLEDREQSVSDAHFQTLHWALEPPSGDIQWDDLAEWLRFGSGHYWICGKAGSGKSTLMKFLHAHEKAKAHLQAWAGWTPLTIGGFFFWNLGTPEQKSHHGLLRGLLYDVLIADPLLIPELLPRTWKEAKQADDKVLELPSAVELEYAFQLLGQQLNTRRKYCFWIDGLDEYSGDYMNGIAFIESLTRNPNIKCIVSSRPIPACVQAFSTCPNLHLQDLTRDDIAKYVDHTVRQHPYMQNILVSDPNEAAALLSDLVEKSSGVFLWVVLACRSLLDGFAAYDHVSDLKTRVDELPPQLEDLFQHMLNKVEPRYLTQAAKLLRVCYWKCRVADTSPIGTLGLALLEDHGMRLDRLPPNRSLTIEEKRAKCQQFEGRLRSRCCGLLEIRKRNERLNNGCLCGQNPHDVVVDSTVEFIHRSVYEFLADPETWDLNCLGFDHQAFDASAALGCLSLHLMRLSFEISGAQAECYIKDILLYGRCIRPATFDLYVPVLEGLEGLLKDLSSQWNSSDFFYRLDMFMPALGGAPLPLVTILAAESGMTSFFLLDDVHTFWKAATVREKCYLLYHAVSRNFLKGLSGWTKNVTFRAIRVLVNHGAYKCNPNWPTRNPSGIATTPWVSWVTQLSTSSPAVALTSTKVTKLFLNSGASLRDVQENVEEGLQKRIERLFVDFGRNNEQYADVPMLQQLKIIRARGTDLLRILEARTTDSSMKPNGEGSYHIREPQQQDKQNCGQSAGSDSDSDSAADIEPRPASVTRSKLTPDRRELPRSPIASDRGISKGTKRYLSPAEDSYRKRMRCSFG